jgi:hypothetical protein
VGFDGIVHCSAALEIVSRRWDIATSANNVLAIFLGIVILSEMYCLNLSQSSFSFISLRVGSDCIRDAPIDIFTGKWSESSSNRGSWLIIKEVDLSKKTSKISGL